MNSIAKRTAILAAGACLALTGCAGGWYGGVDGGATELTEKQNMLMNKELAGKTPGQPVSCISSTQADRAIRVSDSIILYKVSNKLVYRNDLRGSCPGLVRDDDIMVVKSYGGSQRCNGDMIHMVDRYSGIPGGTCSYGKFTPYRSAAAASL